MRTYQADGAGTPVLVLGHGAGAGEDHPWMVRVAEGLATRGLTVVTFNFPYTAAGRRMPDRAPVLEAAFEAAYREVAGTVGRGRRLLAGGKSLGGRIASQVAARGAFAPEPAGLVFLGYPLHPPGRPTQRRDRHLRAISQPMLFVQGTRDPFGTPAELEALVATLSTATLVLVEGGDHSLQAPKRQDPDRRSVDHALDQIARWVNELA